MLYFCGLGLMHALQVDQFDHNFLENSFIAKNRSIKIWDDYNQEIISFLNGMILVSFLISDLYHYRQNRKIQVHLFLTWGARKQAFVG